MGSVMFKRFKNIYVTLAIIVLNFIVLLVLMNVTASIILWHRDKSLAENQIESRGGRLQLLSSTILEAWQSVFPQMSEADLWLLSFEDKERRYVFYEPFTQFAPKPYEGIFFNQHEGGYRWIADQSSWPPSSSRYNVFVFGGSTTYGTNVPDDGTIPSKLQEILALEYRCGAKPIVVYNFARPGYFSTQERILLETLLLKEIVPDFVVFIDGLNDFSWWDGDPQFTSELRDFMERRNGDRSEKMAAIAQKILGRGEEVVGQFGPDILKRLQELRKKNNDSPLNDRLVNTPDAMPSFLKNLAIVRFASKLQAKLYSLGLLNISEKPKPTQEPPVDDIATIERVMDRLSANRRMIRALASFYGFGFAQVLQPVPLFEYDLEYHPFRKRIAKRLWRVGHGYEVVNKVGYGHSDANFVNLSYLQRNRHENLYVDHVHYTPQFATDIAHAIASDLSERGLLPCAIDASPR